MPIFFGVDPTLAAYSLVIGTFASSILLGVTFFQTYYYFNTYSDGPLLKLLVTTVTSFAALHVVFSIHAVCHYLITDYFSPLSLLHSIWSVNILFGVIAIVVLLVQLFYAMRIYMISKKRLLIPIAVSVAALTHLATSWILVAVLFNLKSLLNLPGLPETLAKASLSITVGIDITIAATLSFYLHTSRTGVKQTDRLINRLMMYAINNGILTSVFDIITLTLVITRPRDLTFLAFSQVLTSLYTNSFLATLNARKRSTNLTVVEDSCTVQTAIRFNTAIQNGASHTTSASTASVGADGSSPKSPGTRGPGYNVV